VVLQLPILDDAGSNLDPEARDADSDFSWRPSVWPLYKCRDNTSSLATTASICILSNLLVANHCTIRLYAPGVAELTEHRELHMVIPRSSGPTNRRGLDGTGVWVHAFHLYYIDFSLKTGND
jgi:hypothetical protein